MNHPFTMSHLHKCEKAYEQMEELRYFLECDSIDEVVDCVKKCMADYDACANQLHILRDKINMIERKAA